MSLENELFFGPDSSETTNLMDARHMGEGDQGDQE